MITIQQFTLTSGTSRPFPGPPLTEGNISLKSGLGYDSATTTWTDITHESLVRLFENLDRTQYVFNLRHNNIIDSFGHWYPVTFEPTIKRGGYSASVIWRRWDDPSAIEQHLEDKIRSTIITESNQSDVISLSELNRERSASLGFTRLTGSPYWHWNLLLASMPPFNFRTETNVPRYSPFPGLAIGEDIDLHVLLTPSLQSYILFGVGLVTEILSDIFKDEDQDFSDVLKELREYQLALLFTNTEHSAHYPITPRNSYDIHPTLPTQSQPSYVMSRQLMANDFSYVAPLDDKYTRPISCLYSPTNNYFVDSESIEVMNESSKMYAYVDRPGGLSDPRTPLKVKHPQKSREKAILETHLQRYKLLEDYNRANISLTLTDETIQMRPLSTLIFPAELYHLRTDVVGTILSVTHSYPSKGPRLTSLQIKLFPPVT